MSFGNYNNQNLSPYFNNQVASKFGNESKTNTTEKTSQIESSERTFDIFDVQERINNKDFSVLQELSSLGIKYNFEQNSTGHFLSFDYNGSHYEISYIEPAEV